jgi:hypothetical protein
MSIKDRKITIIGAIILVVGTIGVIYYRDHRTVINGIAVPPMPNSRENNATLLGVDVDQNGIRDDIDRKIAEAYGDNKWDYRVVTGYFRALEIAMANPTELNVITVGTRVSCLGIGYNDVTVIEKQLLNNELRGAAYGHALAGSTIKGVCVPE